MISSTASGSVGFLSLTINIQLSTLNRIWSLRKAGRFHPPANTGRKPASVSTKRGQTIVCPHHCRPKQRFLDGSDAVWRIVSGVVCQFGDAITIHVLGGMGVQPGSQRGSSY